MGCYIRYSDEGTGRAAAALNNTSSTNPLWPCEGERFEATLQNNLLLCLERGLSIPGSRLLYLNDVVAFWNCLQLVELPYVERSEMAANLCLMHAIHNHTVAV